MPDPQQNNRALRSELIILLSQACELEHSLACSMLFNACSLKQSLAEGITERQLTLTNRWAEEMFDAALAKMLQFTQVWNLFTAVGCNPYHWRPNFPIPANYYAINLPLELLPFGTVSLERCLHSELPDDDPETRRAHGNLSDNSPQAAVKYRSIAQIYSVMYEIFETIPEQELLVGKQERQIGRLFPEFSSLIRVVDTESALLAINLLRGRREPDDGEREDRGHELSESSLNRAHQYEMLLRLRNEYRSERQQAEQTGDRFAVVRDVLTNPVLAKGVDYRVPILTQPQQSVEPVVGRLIQEPCTRNVALLFEQVYSVILALLQYVFRMNPNDSFAPQIFTETATRMIPRVLKPLAELLTQLPAGSVWGQQTAGPTFGMSRYVPFHPNPKIAKRSVQTRLRELVLLAAKLEKDARIPPQMTIARQHLEELLSELREHRVSLAVDGEPGGLNY